MKGGMRADASATLGKRPGQGVEPLYFVLNQVTIAIAMLMDTNLIRTRSANRETKVNQP
jgi:hypothetical protein